MSPADVMPAPVRTAPAGSVPARPVAAWGRLVRSEIRLVLGRRRNQVLLALLAAFPVLIGTVVRIAQDSALSGQGPGFLDRVSSNGLFLVVTVLFMCLPFLLPLTTGIAAGDAVAGEAQAGTLRYLLTVPVGRGRLLAAKALAVLVFVGLTVLAIGLVALATGAALFGLDDLVLLSGTTVPLADGVLRIAGVVAYVAMSLTGLIAVGLFLSTLTEVPVGAMAATVVVSIVSAVLDSLPQLSAVHPVLLTHHWFDFAEFLRIEVDPGVIAQGALVQAGWVAVFGALAWARFTTADVTS